MCRVVSIAAQSARSPPRGGSARALARSHTLGSAVVVFGRTPALTAYALGGGGGGDGGDDGGVGAPPPSATEAVARTAATTVKRARTA